MKDEIQKRRLEILDYATDRGWTINPSKGMEPFVESFLKLGHCPCDANRPNCPCPEAELEIVQKGKCRCGLYWASYQAFRKILRPVKGEKDEGSPEAKTKQSLPGRGKKQRRPRSPK